MHQWTVLFSWLVCRASVFVYVGVSVQNCIGEDDFFFFFFEETLPIMMTLSLLCRVQCLWLLQWPQFNANMSLSCHHVTASPTSLLLPLLTHLFMQMFIEKMDSSISLSVSLVYTTPFTSLFKTLITVRMLLIMTESAKRLLTWRFYIALYIFIVLSAYADTQMINLTQWT